MQTIAFIDLEASSLGPHSWPIEVGWCFLDGEPEAHLIRPATVWPREAWTDRAEGLHGISLEMVETQGKPIRQVCDRLNEALGAAQVFSDAPDWDGFWLYRLFSIVGISQRFVVRHLTEALGDCPEAIIDAASDHAARLAPRRHRARDDVLHMRAMFRQSSIPE